MANCCNKCGNKGKCGCNDSVLHLPPSCPAPTCPDPEPCAETWSDCCVIHNGDSFTYITPEAPAVAAFDPGPVPEKTYFTILQGERMCDTWQKFLAYYECGSPVVYGLKSKSITSTTINIAWTPLTEAVSYTVYIAPVSTAIWTSPGVVTQNTTPNFTITGLTPNTSYYVCVAHNTEVSQGCASVSLILTTSLT